MEVTRFDLKTQAIQERIASALERIAAFLEKLEPTTAAGEFERRDFLSRNERAANEQFRKDREREK